MITDVKLVISRRKKEKGLTDDETVYCDNMEEARMRGNTIWNRVRMQRRSQIQAVHICYREDGALRQECVFTGL